MNRKQSKEHGLKILKYQKGKKGPDAALARAIGENMVRKAEEIDNHGKSQAKAQLDSIKEMVERMRKAYKENNDAENIAAQEAIQDDPLSIGVRSDWYTPGTQDNKPSEYNILLCTGGPACRIIGSLTEHGEPESARIEYQDWGTPWTVYWISGDEEDIVLEYARCFYFGD